MISNMLSEEIIFVTYIKIAALTIPFYVILSVLISVFRGHQRTLEKILFYDLGRNIFFLIFSLIVGILSVPFIGVIWSMFASTVLVSILFLIYYKLKKYKISDNIKSFYFLTPIGKKLFVFSIPLVFVDIMYQILGWSDTILIGYFLTESQVGFYNVARPLSSFISTGLTVTLFIYSPLVAGLYALRKFKENSIIYSSLTKWICLFTLPLTLSMFFYSEVIISYSFGREYIFASIPLKILSIIYFFDNMMGPNGATLTAYGKTRFLLGATSLSALINIILNIILIPIYGITGAAIATGISIISINIVRTFKLYLISGIHSLNPSNIKPIISTILLNYILYFILSQTKISYLFQIIFMFIFTIIIYFLMLFLTKSISSEDIKMLKIIEKKVGINLSIFRRILDKFT